MSIVRLRVPPTFTLPTFSQLGDGLATVPAPHTSGTTVVVDTADLVLARWGVRLTHDGSRWQLRLPAHPAGERAAPVEHTLRVSQRTIPALAEHATRHLRDGRDLTRVARLTVRRRALGVVRDGDVAVHVSDEEVSVHTGRRLSGRFREVVLQPGPAGDDAVAAAVEQRLVEAGALERDSVPREVRILGPGAVASPDLPHVRGVGDAAAAWHGALVAGLRDLLVVGVHLRLDDRGRTAAASLGTLDRLVGLTELLDADADATSGLATLRTHVDEVAALADRVALLGGDLRQLRDRGSHTLGRAVRRVHDHLDSHAYAAAVDAVRALAADPGVTGEEAAGSARDSVAVRVGKRWTHLAPSLDAGHPVEPASLAALAAGAAVAEGKAPARFAAAAAAAAGAARDHARAVRIQAWCREEAALLEPAEAYLAGHLAGRRAEDAAEAVERWNGALDRLTRERATKWLP